MLCPDVGRFGKALFSGGELFEQPVRFVAALGFPLDEHLARVADRHLAFLEGGAEFNRALVLRDGLLEDARAAIARAAIIPAASAA